MVAIFPLLRRSQHTGDRVQSAFEQQLEFVNWASPAADAVECSMYEAH
jgi:hypothetical protein